MNYNSVNKSLYVWIESLPEENENGVIHIRDIINNRIMILLQDGERFEWKLDVPKWTNVLFISPEWTTDLWVEVTYINGWVSRTYWIKWRVNIRNAQTAYNKNNRWSVGNYDIQGKTRNQWIKWWVSNQWVQGNIRNTWIDEEGVLNVKNNWDIFNSEVKGFVSNDETNGDLVNIRNYWWVYNTHTRGTIVNQKITWWVGNTSTWWRIGNFLISGTVRNVRSCDEVLNWDIKGLVFNEDVWRMVTNHKIQGDVIHIHCEQVNNGDITGRRYDETNIQHRELHLRAREVWI